ncbi:MAG: nitroreductase family protein [Chitinivibrionales bacterium]
MNRFDALIRRKSTRQYAPKAVPSEILEEIAKQIDSIHPPFDTGHLNVDLIEDGSKVHLASKGLIGPFGKNKAPHFLILSGKPLEGMRESAGYVGEHLVISLTALGLATCWLGGHIKKGALSSLINAQDGHQLAAIIAFGLPKEPEGHLRKDISRIRRKHLEQLTADGSVDPRWEQLLEAVRIAPSAINSQPWRFYCDGKRLHMFIRPAGSFLSQRMLGKVNFVDAGIALCHLAEAAKFYNRSITFESTPDVRYAELIYIITIVDK